MRDVSGESFAAMLRSRRLRAALSQEELSKRAELSVRAVRDLEAGRIARPRPRTVGLLADVLALTGDERCVFTSAALTVSGQRTGGRVPSPVAPPSPLTPLIGRSAELARVRQALRGPARLVTITGLGGVGKTRLAQAVGGDTAVVWVPLSGLAVAAADVTYAVIDAVAQAVGAPGAGLHELPEVVTDPTVLLLDACEQVPGIGALIEELLGRCASLTVLATSRGPVGAAGEYEHPLGPLVVPAPGAEADLAGLAEVPSVRLLLDRISARRPEFTLDATNAAPVVRLVRRLGGLPLALELAAAQCRVRDPADLLAEPFCEHVRLRTAIDGSVALLDGPCAGALARLSVFAGGWTLPAAAAVLDGVDVVSVHDTLIAHGFASRDGDGRFAMLDMIREHAVDRAGAAGGLADTAARHAAYYGRLVVDTASDLEATLAPASLATLDAERDNIRVALDWSRRHDRVAGLRMVEALKHYWFMRSRYPEAARWLADLLPAKGNDDEAQILCYSQGHRYAAVCWLAMGDRAKALDHAKAALTYARRGSDELMVAAARSALGRALFYVGESAAAERNLRAAFAAAVHSGHWAAVLAAAALADLLSARGDVDEARRIARRARDVAVASGRTGSLPWAWHAMARAAWRAGDLAAVGEATSAMLDLCDHLGDCPAIRLRALAYTAAAAAAQGLVTDGLRAVELTGRLAPSAGLEDRALARWARVEVALAAAVDVREATVAALPDISMFSNRPYLIDVFSAYALSTVDTRPMDAALAVGLADAARVRHGVSPTCVARARLTTITDRGRALLGPDDWASAVQHGSTRSVADLIAVLRTGNCRLVAAAPPCAAMSDRLG